MTLDHIYSGSRLRAMDYRVVDNNQLQRIVDCENIQGAMRILSETAYSEWFSEMKHETDFETAISAELGFIYGEVSRFVPDKRLHQMLRLPYDVHNFKVLLKGQIRKKRNEDRRMDLLSPLGNLSIDDVIMAVESEDFRLLPFGFHSALPECVVAWDQNHDIPGMEKILDDALFNAMSAISVEMGEPGVTAWVRTRIDAENVRNMVRLKRKGFDPGDIASFLHRGGWVSTDRLGLLLGEPIEGWDQSLPPAGVSSVLSQFRETTDLGLLAVDIERALDDYVTDYSKRFRYSPFAPENAIAYLWSKEIDAKNVRIAMVGVANGADRATVGRLIRHV